MTIVEHSPATTGPVATQSLIVSAGPLVNPKPVGLLKVSPASSDGEAAAETVT